MNRFINLDFWSTILWKLAVLVLETIGIVHSAFVTFSCIVWFYLPKLILIVDGCNNPLPIIIFMECIWRLDLAQCLICIARGWICSAIVTGRFIFIVYWDIVEKLLSGSKWRSIVVVITGNDCNCDVHSLWNGDRNSQCMNDSVVYKYHGMWFVLQLEGRSS